MTLKSLFSVVEKRTSRDRRRCRVCCMAAVMGRLREFEQAIARKPAAYSGIKIVDLMEWSGFPGPYSTFLRHIRQHQPKVSDFFSWKES